MRPAFKKLEVKDIGDLEKLVTENVEGIEPGLKVIDSRLLLGDAAIDLVALDLKESLVLIALDFTADEGLLLRVMDAYSWCLEYPDTVRRLYPMAQISSGRPPRILFIVERLTDSFMRRIKQLSFLEIDCLEFRHLEVNGTSALYFDLVQRLRKSEADKAVAHSERQAPQMLQAPPGPQPPQTLTGPPVAQVVGPAPQAVPVIEPPRLVIEPARPVLEPTRPVVEPAPAVVAEAPAAPAAAPQPPAPEPTPSLEARATQLFAEPAVSAVEGPEVEAGAPTVEESRMEDAEPPVLEIEPVAPLVDASRNPEWQALLSQLGVEMPVRPSPAASEPSVPEVEPVVAAATEPIDAVVETPKAPEPPAPTPPTWAKPQEKAVQPSAGRTYFFAQAVKGTTSAEPQAAQPAPAAAAAPAPAASAAPAAAPTAPAAPAAPAARASAVEAPAPDRPELESLSFPKDGLSRQWLEFLNQLSAAK